MFHTILQLKLEENYNKYLKKFNRIFPNFDTEFIEFIKKAVDRISLHINYSMQKILKFQNKIGKMHMQILIGGLGLDRLYNSRFDYLFIKIKI